YFDHPLSEVEISYFFKTPICASANTKVIGIIPNTLKATHVSVENPLHITSLRTARKTKNSAQRSVKIFQPSSERRMTSPKTILRNSLPVANPPNRMVAKRAFTIVG